MPQLSLQLYVVAKKKYIGVLAILKPVVTICTTCFNNKKLRLLLTQFVYVYYNPYNQLLLFLYAASSSWFLYQIGISSL
jgi:hypothetical protein